MAITSEFQSIAIAGGGIESYWAALAFARQVCSDLGAVILFDDPEFLQPLVTAGDWLEECHEQLGVSHEAFLRVLRPRLSLGLEVATEGTTFFVPSTQTGFSYKHSSFSRLYASLRTKLGSSFLEYNYAYVLYRSGTSLPPRHSVSALCDGLKMVYQFDGKRYKEFLAEALSKYSVSVVAADTSNILRDRSGAIVSSAYTALMEDNSLLIDFWWVKTNKPVWVETEMRPSTGFFAANQLNVDRHNYIRRLHYGGPWMMEYFHTDPVCHNVNDFKETAFWTGRQIKMGVDGLELNLLASKERVFYRQLQSILFYWPECHRFSLLAKKINRDWNAWRQEALDIQELILVAVGQGAIKSSANLARMDLFREVGVVPEREGAIFTNAEWENILVAGLGVEPGYRGLPQDIGKAEGLSYLNRVKRSYSDSI